MNDMTPEGSPDSENLPEKEENSSTKSSVPEGPPSLISILQLMRIPNLFTAIADVMMGYLIVRGGLQEPDRFFLLLGSSCAIYLAGMVLNDVYDLKVDTKERPQRPIPSGRVSLGFARKLGFGLLLLGVACAGGASLAVGSLRPLIVASLLAICVWLYDGVLKRTFISPVLMGSCRSLNVLLAMSADPAPWSKFNWLIAAGVGIYIAGVTWFARTEASRSSQIQLGAGTLIALSGIALIARTPYLVFGGELPSEMKINVWNQLWIFLAAIIGWRMVRAVMRPEPVFIQPAVKVAILSVIVIDASICLGWIGLNGPAGVPWVLMIILLYFPAMFLGRWVYST